MWYVNILMRLDTRTYLGYTNDLKRRMLRHKKGFVSATKKRLPVELIVYFAIKGKKSVCI